jgi:hypothetical protein
VTALPLSVTMSSKYCAGYPTDVSYNPAMKTFLEEFYTITDTPDVHETYVDFFIEDATLILGSTTAKGRAGAFRPTQIS